MNKVHKDIEQLEMELMEVVKPLLQYEQIVKNLMVFIINFQNEIVINKDKDKNIDKYKKMDLKALIKQAQELTIETSKFYNELKGENNE